MKKGLIKICIVIILILYCLLDRFIIVIPFIVTLLLLFLTEFKSLKFSNVATNLIYPKRYFYLILFSIIMLLRSPNIEEAKFQIIVMTVLMVTSFLLYFYIKKYNYFYLILHSTLFISFINHIAALNIPIFDFLMFNSEEVGGNEGVINGWGWSGRFSGILDNPNALAILLIYSLFLSLFVLNYPQNIIRITKIGRFICILNIILCFYTIFMTQSRKGIVFGIMLLIISFLLKFSVKKFFPYIIGICIIGFLYLLLPNIGTSFEGGLERLESVFNIANNSTMIDNSTAMRLYFINEGLKGFIEYPIFGHGINSFRYYYEYYAHNNYIELLFGTGLVGFLIYYSIHLNVLKNLLSNWKKNFFITLFVIILLFMDVGYVSYESKLNMLTFVTLFMIIDYSNLNTQYESVNNYSIKK